MRPTLNQLLCTAVLLGGLSLAGCKQNEGERCEIDSDCAAGLTCNTRGAGLAKGVCTSGTPGVPLPDAAPRSEAGPAADVGAADQAADQAVSPDVSGDGPKDVSPDTQPDVTAPAPDAPAGGG
jgi:hypothetical protein